MFNIKSYFKSTIEFVNSLTIKIDEISRHFNYHFYIKNNLEAPKFYEDKYYLNLAGMLSKIDSKIYVHDDANNVDIEVTPENLDSNQWLKSELGKYDTLFKEVNDRYPGMTTYIRGCIKPTPLTDLINIPNYTILSYDKSYIDDNEAYLISEIEDYITKFFYTYHNPAYMLDELYLPALLMILYQSIVMFVITKRLSNILTYKADNFHINNFLSSYKDIYEILDIYNKETEIYLYGNIRRIKKVIGRNKTLEEILYKVFDKNLYGIGKILFVKRAPTLIEGDVYNFKKEYFKNDYSFITNKANDSFYNLNEVDMPLYKLIAKEDNNDLVHDDYILSNDYNYKFRNDEKFLKNKRNKLPTKIFILDKPEKLSINYNNTIVSTFSNLLSGLLDSDDGLYVDYINHVNHKIYKLSGKDLTNILVGSILKKYNITSGDVNIELNGVIKTNYDTDIVLNSTWYKQKNKEIWNFLIEGIEFLTFNSGSIIDYFNFISNLEKKIWFLISNVDDLTLKNDIRVMSKYLLGRRMFNTNADTVFNYLAENNLDIFLEGDFIENTIKLLEKITNVELRPYKSIIERFKKIVSFFNKTTSYTVQLIYDTEFKGTLVNTVTKSNMNLGYKSFIEIKAAEFYMFEQADYLIRSYAVRFDGVRIGKDVEEVTLNTSRIGLTPCISIYDGISTSPIVMGATHMYYKKYGSSIRLGSKRIGLDNNIRITGIEQEIDFSEINYMQTRHLSTAKIGEDNLAILASSKLARNDNYRTRGVNTSLMIDNKEITINDDDDIIPIKGMRDTKVYTDVETTNVTNLSYTNKKYPKFYSTSILVRSFGGANEDIEINENASDFYGTNKLLKDFSVLDITDDFIENEYIPMAIPNGRLKTTSLIDKVYDEFIVGDDNNLTYSITDNDKIENSPLRDGEVYTDVEDLDTFNSSYKKNGYLRNARTGTISTTNYDNDDDILGTLQATPYNKLYQNRVVETEVNEIEVDLIYEIKNR